LLSVAVHADETRMDATICPSTHDSDWLISTNSPHHVPTVAQGKPVATRAARSGPVISRTVISRPSGFAGPDRIRIAAAVYGTRVTLAT
jgi:hypothetical protein